jgi:hypothetical protein
MLRRCTSGPSAICSSHTSTWMNCEPGCAALNTCSGSGWRLIPAPRFCPSSREAPAPRTWPMRGCPPCDRCWPQAVFRFSPVMGSTSPSLRLSAHFGDWLQVGRRGRNVQKTAGGGWSPLRSSETKLPAAQAGARHARDALGDRGRSQGLLAGDGLLWTAPYRLSRTGSTDGPTWGGSARTTDLGEGSACSTAPSPSGVVASV